MYIYTAFNYQRDSIVNLSDTRVYEPQIRARLGTTAQLCKVVVLNTGGGERRGEGGPNFCRGTSHIRNRAPLGPYSSPMPRALW